MRGDVRWVHGIPNWFTLALHYWYRRRCRKVGHEGAGGRPAAFICVCCGQLLNGMTNEEADEIDAKMMRWLRGEER